MGQLVVKTFFDPFFLLEKSWKIVCSLVCFALFVVCMFCLKISAPIEKSFQRNILPSGYSNAFFLLFLHTSLLESFMCFTVAYLEQ